MIWFYFQKKIELHFGCGPCWPSFCPNRVLRRAIFNNFTKFFFKTTMITQVININSMSQHISLEISKKNPQWVELKGKIWHKQSATYLTCFALGKLNDEYQEILVLLHFPTPPPPLHPFCYWWLIMKKHGWKLYHSPNPNPRGGGGTKVQ